MYISRYALDTRVSGSEVCGMIYSHKVCSREIKNVLLLRKIDRGQSFKLNASEVLTAGPSSCIYCLSAAKLFTCVVFISCKNKHLFLLLQHKLLFFLCCIVVSVYQALN